MEHRGHVASLDGHPDRLRHTARLYGGVYYDPATEKVPISSCLGPIHYFRQINAEYGYTVHHGQGAG
ncbi:unnamed protein product [Strongylus vulgaris]|uniref:Uncharacterized protein n=1 Tax=Strongylus vulgaris TaxID=40348 RepID=A0A3P7JLB5_STRVU|nr:unnamed protein product [Strongylus vulgaris]